jgi:hypothetical protein
MGTHQMLVLSRTRHVLCCDLTTMILFDASGKAWTSDRLAYDELRVLRVDDRHIYARSYDPPTSGDVDSTIDLLTGKLITSQPASG